MGDSTSIPAGWYPDPERAGQLRYWDGIAWTEQRHATAATPPPPTGGVPIPPTPYPPVAVDRSQAGMALAFSIIGLVLCIVFAPIGMVMGRNELQRIDAGQGDIGARGMAQAAWIIGLIGTILIAVAIIGAVLLLAVFASAS